MLTKKVYITLYHSYDYYEFTDFIEVCKTQQECLASIKVGSKVALSEKMHDKYATNEESHYYIFEESL